MKSVICPTCGCSLVRLGITREQAARAAHARTLYFFCCEGCAARFRADPERYLAQIADVVVCPGCLGEQPAPRTVTIEVAGQTVHVCGCPGLPVGGRTRPRPLPRPACRLVKLGAVPPGFERLVSGQVVRGSGRDAVLRCPAGIR
jgi:YHS domain